MIEDETTNYAQESGWVELANGGGLLFRDPSAPVGPPPKYTPLRRTNQLPEHASRSEHYAEEG